MSKKHDECPPVLPLELGEKGYNQIGSEEPGVDEPIVVDMRRTTSLEVDMDLIYWSLSLTPGTSRRATAPCGYGS